jgi:hypothetical protein
MAPLYLCQPPPPPPPPREILSNGSLQLSGPMTLLGLYRTQFTAAGYYEGKRQTVEVRGGEQIQGRPQQIKTT